MFTQHKYSIYNFDSPFYQTGLEVSKRSSSGKKIKVTKEATCSKFSFSRLFTRPKHAF